MSKTSLVIIFVIYTVFIYLLMKSNLYCAFIIWTLFFSAIVLYHLHEHKISKTSSKFTSLQDLAKARGMFMNVASHELRNPMMIIHSSVDLLENYGDKLEKNEKFHLFENMRKSIRRMARMMDDIVLIGQLQHQKIGYNPQPINILHLCSSIAENLEQDKTAKRIQLTMEHNVKPMIKIDVSLLNYTLTNLLSNALKYSDGLVELKIKAKRGHIIFDVIDCGIGIPLEEIQKLPQLFKRGSNTGTRQGVGIGMYLATHCVKWHRGTIKIFSRENEGTHFRAIFPVINV